MISNSRKSLGALAEHVLALSQKGSDWPKGEGALQFIREFERHSDNPEAFEQLVQALEELGGSSVDLILIPVAELAYMPLVVMRQHAVGHGGFHAGAMGRGSARLRWVYDCGSLKTGGKEQLSKEIERLAGDGSEGRRRVDLLFISHFDRDHVSGIEELMSAVDVETVVIPYLDDLQRAAVLVSELAEREEPDADVDRRLTQVLFDPVAWLTKLGAERVVQVRPAGPGFDGSRVLRYGPGDGPDLPEEVGRAQPVLVRQNDMEPMEADDQGIVDCGSGWMVTHFGRSFGDWCFLPYVTPTRQEALHAFREAFGALLARRQGETLVRAFRRRMDEEGFAGKVKATYREHELGDANAVSMSLFVGPFREGVWYGRKSLSAGQRWPMAGPGWLLTGDAKLAQVDRREDWLRFYAPLKARIGAMMLPHHGSHLNFHEGVLDAVQGECLLFACRKEKVFGDPLHENVWPIVKDRAVAVVSDDRTTSLMQVSGAAILRSAESALSDLADEWC